MKKFLAALLTAAIIISSSVILAPLTVGAADEVPYDRMIALYNMNGDIKDSVSGESGTLKNEAGFINDEVRGNVLFLDNDGVVSPGTGAGYDEEGQHAVLADSHIPDSDQMTISLWFNSKELRGWARVIDFGDARPEKGVNNNPDRFINIAPTNGTHTIGTVNINDSTAGIPNNRDRVWADLASENEWVHAVLVINAGSGKPNVLYLNGVPFESTNGGADDDSVPATFSPKDILASADGVGSTFLGRSRFEGNGDQIFNGYIDDVAIFDVALTAEQVAALAKADLNSITPYPLSDKSYDVAAPELGELMTGTLIGAVGGWGDNPATGRNAAFDGDSETFYDPAEAGNPEHFAGIQMDEPYFVTEIRILPRAGRPERFNGASIWGFDGDTFDPETATLIWASEAAAEAIEFQVISAEDFLVNDTAFTNFAYFNQVEHGDVAEIELYGISESENNSSDSYDSYDVAAPELNELMVGELIGAVGGWGDNPATGRTAAFDGDSETFYDPAEKANPEHFAGIQMDEPYFVTEIRILPRAGRPERFNGASIWGFDGDTFDPETATLIWASEAAAEAVEFQIISAEDFLVNDTAFTSYAYFNEVEHGDVAEIELYGIAESAIGVDSGSSELYEEDIIEDIENIEDITVGMVYLFAAEQLANVSNSIEALIADPNAYIKKSGLLTDNDELRYFMETGYKFDFDAPITRQEYALIIDRMLNLLKKYGIEMIQNTELQYRGSNIDQMQGFGRIDSFAVATSENGIGVMPYSDQRNVGVGGISSNNIHAHSGSFANSYNRQTLDTYTDGSEIRGSVRNAVAEMFNLGFLKAKSFDEKQIFFIEDPKAKEEDKVELYSDEFYAKNEAAKERLENYYIKRDQQVVLEKGLFIAPNDILTQEELGDLLTVLTSSLKASGYTERAVMAPILMDLLNALSGDN